METNPTAIPTDPAAIDGMDPRITVVPADAQHEATPACPAVAAANAGGA